jgi:hypothetical protein
MASKRRIERQLRSIVAELAEARSQVIVANEQYAAFQDDDEDARTRSLGSDSIEAARTAEQSHRHAELMREQVLRAEQRVKELEKRRDALLLTYEP